MDKNAIYKIEIANRKDSEEVQKLLISAGFKWNFINSARIVHPFNYPIALYIRPQEREYFCGFDGEAVKVKVPEIKDLSTLIRNDVKDASHKDNQDKSIYLTNDNTIYYWDGEWIDSAINRSNQYEQYLKNSLKPINASELVISLNEGSIIKVEGLECVINGKAALAAALNGDEIQMTLEPWETSSWQSFNPEFDEASTKEFWTDLDSEGRKIFFRIKPNHFLINGIEVPAPLTKEPMVKTPYFYLRPDWENGFCKATWEDLPIEKKRFRNGIWSTESAIRQVVEAFRKTIQVL